MPDTTLLFTSFNVTVIVEVVVPSAVTELGEAETVDWAAVTAPAVKVTVAVWVTVIVSVVSVAVNTSTAAVVDFTVNVATPDASVVPWVVVIAGVPAPDVCANVTVLPDTTLLFTSFNVTVIVEVAVPSASTEVGEAETVDCAAVTAPGVKVTTEESGAPTATPLIVAVTAPLPVAVGAVRVAL